MNYRWMILVLFCVTGCSDARRSYDMAKQQYRYGDWDMARTNFRIAIDLGFKPNEEEDSPENYLYLMDLSVR